MRKEILNLRQADGIEIITLVDNFSDVLLPDSEAVMRPPIAKGGVIPKNTLLAEHGLSLLVKVRVEEKTHSIVLDTGYTNEAVPYNLEYLGLTLEDVEAIVLSHGHMDHVGALKEVVGLSGSGTKCSSATQNSGSRLRISPWVSLFLRVTRAKSSEPS